MSLGLVGEYYTRFCEILQGDSVSFLFLLGTSFPAALLLKYIPSPTIKQVFSITIALIQTYLICAGDTLLPILLCLFSYLALRVVPKNVTGRVIFHVSFSLLLIFKLIVFSDLFVPSYLVDSVLLLMVLRVCSYGYDYQLDRILEGDNKDNSPSQLSSLFDYVGYCFCFVGYWTGPFFTYSTYNKMLHSKTLIRSSKLALSHMTPMLVILPLHMLQTTYNSLDYTMDEEFLTQSFLYKFLYLLAGFWTFKVKFFGGWIIAEGICIACNLGTVEKEDGTVDYSSIINIDIYNTEINWELSQCVRAWNKSVQYWMKTYVYDTTHLPKAVRTEFVFGLSAFWHGIRPGYYLTFLSTPPMIKLQQKVGNLTAKARENSPNLEMVYRIVSWICVRVISCMILAPFYMLDLDKILALYSSMYWVPQITVGVVFILSVILPQGQRPERPKTS
ncbi:lysophospholipid acyltransferase 7-like [Bolinopsis microptera]|uniref:lysophospholipid acyltransferase 7-like n=1 Tax=Bolinopsis microptera TaxID=2820187 RepID=UPI003078AF07